MKRYRLAIDSNDNAYGFEDDTGEWVRWEDAEAIHQELKQFREVNRDLFETVRKYSMGYQHLQQQAEIARLKEVLEVIRAEDNNTDGLTSYSRKILEAALEGGMGECTNLKHSTMDISDCFECKLSDLKEQLATGRMSADKTLAHNNRLIIEVDRLQDALRRIASEEVDDGNYIASYVTMKDIAREALNDE
jgi:regulator of replication initiation timing